MMNYQPNAYYTGVQTRAAEASLIQRVSYLLCTMLLVTAASAWWAAQTELSTALFFPLFLGTLACVIAISFTRRQPGVSVLLLYVLSALEGLLIGPVIGMIVRGYTMGATIVAQSAALSAVLVGGLGTYVWISNKDFGYLGRMLFWGLIGLLVVGVIGIFVHMGSGMTLVYALVGTAIFVGFTLYDFSNIKHRYGPDDFAIATVQLYLDFINLFWLILRILMEVSGGGRRSD